jgi:hypothetical protein
MLKLNQSRGSLEKATIITGEHEAMISRASFYSDNTGTFAVFDFTLPNGVKITQVYDIEECSMRSRVVRSWVFITRIRELAAAIGIDLGPIDTGEDFKKAFTGRRVVVDLEQNIDDSLLTVDIKRFAPSRLKPGTSRA